MLLQTVRPPRERGTTWSKVSSCVRNLSPQYWQFQRSRRKTLNRVKAGLRAAGIYSFRARTLGSRSSWLGERTTLSYSETITTDSRKTALRASCHDQTERGK